MNLQNQFNNLWGNDYEQKNGRKTVGSGTLHADGSRVLLGGLCRRKHGDDQGV